MPKPQIHEFPEPTREQLADWLRRAKAAWAATGEPGAPTDRSGFVLHEGLGYVVLRGRGVVLAVYRVRPDNLVLRRLKRWPHSLEDVVPSK